MNASLPYLFKSYNPPPAKGTEMTRYEPGSHMSTWHAAPLAPLSRMNPYPGGLGTSLTASLCPDAHLRWTMEQLRKIGKGLARAPSPPHIKQRLLMCGAHSKIAHTHCIMALSPQAMKEVESFVEKKSRKICGLPASFPRAGMHAPVEKIGLNIPSI